MLMTRKLPDPTLSMEKSRFSSDTTTSPRSPLDIQIRSPCRVLNNCRIRDGVGLGIVAALDKSGSSEAAVKLILDSLSLTRSNSIPIGSAKPDMGGWDDEYTCVTSHGPNNKSGAIQPSSQSSFEEFPTSGFLSSCYLCRKKLHGKDIYMYRGEKAFCSTECRYKQIVSDQRKDKCRSKASRSLNVSVSPHSRGQLFSTGIFAV